MQPSVSSRAETQELVMTLFPDPEAATATKMPLLYATPSHTLSAGVCWVAHVIPSLDVMTRFPVPLLATATNRPLPKQMLLQLLSAALVLVTHVIPPSLDVMTRLPNPVTATATMLDDAMA